MILTEQAIYDFLNCPLYYYTKHIQKIELEQPHLLKNAISYCIHFFYANLLNGKVKTYRELQTKWDSQSTYFDSKDIIKGWAQVYNVASWTEENKLIIGDVNCQYTYNFKTVSVSGNIDYVVLFGKDQIELLYFDFSDKKPNALESGRKLKYALDYYGFESLYGSPPARIRIHNVKYKEDVFLNFVKEDRARLNSCIYHVAKSIEYGLYYPREGFMCNHCTGKGYCRYFCELTSL